MYVCMYVCMYVYICIWDKHGGTSVKAVYDGIHQLVCYSVVDLPFSNLA